MSNHNNFFYRIEWSGILTFFGIVLLFTGAVGVTLIAPGFVDSTWTQPTSYYQRQMYEVADPNTYISALRAQGAELQAVYHLKKDYTLLAFQETETVRILAPPQLQKYVTHFKDDKLKLTSHLLLLRKPQVGKIFNAVKEAENLQKALQEQWIQNHSDWKDENLQKLNYDIWEIYEPDGNEAFAIASINQILENWVDRDFVILNGSSKETYHQDPGVIYVNNPREYRVTYYKVGNEKGWRYDPDGEKVTNLEQLRTHPLGFRSRKELIEFGEHLYAIEGCWYCHTDQTRTLVQDCVMNGSDSYPAPPSCPNEYIYQYTTFPGTRRIGPDLSRVGVKRPSRDWHQSHFWSPKTASKGSIMPAFQHFFDYDPRGSGKKTNSIPNYKFEAMFQYLMTKGTRITPPTQAWWLGKDPVKTKEIIEGLKELP